MRRGGSSLTHSERTPPARVNQKPKSKGCVPPLRSGPLAALRFEKYVHGRRKIKKEERKMPSLVAH